MAPLKYSLIFDYRGFLKILKKQYVPIALCMSATGCFSIGFLFRFMYQLAVQIVSHRGNSTFGNRFQNGASRFAQMMAVIETAMPEIRA